MKAEEKIARLEGLLERVRRNATLPRHRAAEPALSTEPADGFSHEAGDGMAAAPIEETSVVEVGEPIAAIDIGEEEIEVEELDLTEEELVDLTEPESLRPPAAPEIAAEAASDEASIDWEEIDEPPASSRRPIAAESIDAALEASAHVELDEGREIPLKTPPPESGPQAAPPPYVPPAAPVPLDAEPLSEGDIQSPSVPPMRADESLFELDEPPAEIEVAQSAPTPAPPPVIEALEAPIEHAPESGEVAPDVVARPALPQAAPSSYVAAVRGFRPSTFVELLDASLSLGE